MLPAEPLLVLEDLLGASAEVADRQARAWLQTKGGGHSWVLHGAGQLGRRVLAHMHDQGHEVVALTDRNPSRWGQEVDGMTVQPPEVVLPQMREGAAVLVTIFNTHSAFRDVALELAPLTSVPVLPVQGYFWRYPETFLPAYGVDLPSTFLRSGEAILQAASLLADAESQRQFTAQIQWRLHLESNVLPIASPTLQYFDPALVPKAWDGIFVDAGAYDGDTLKVLRCRQGGTLPPVLALEPDPDSFARMQAWTEALPIGERDRAELKAIALGAKHGETFFETGLGTGSHAGEEGMRVLVRPLHDLMGSRRLGFLKMDLEGAEQEALDGAAPLIERDAPIGAICIYHRPSDFWCLPSYIAGLFRQHTFHLRTHGEDGFDVVWYAIPKLAAAR